jgi:hypothetical protein
MISIICIRYFSQISAGNVGETQELHLYLFNHYLKTHVARHRLQMLQQGGGALPEKQLLTMA